MRDSIIIFDYSNLRGAIKSKGYIETAFAKEIDLSAVTLSSKLNGKTGFTESEMCRIMDVLGIDYSEVARYFFCRNT
ncbi:MAG: DUF739 family protein [Longicatena sp.]|uniref:DUF739 family protein n=1 Tax=Anaerorhabdus sp. TaxID=1872524 RepID=UPI002FCA1381